MKTPKSPKHVRFLELVLRPIAKFCVRYSYKLQDVTDSIKAVLVEAAVSEMKTRGERVNVSRVSVMTGVHRRDVSRIFEEGKTLSTSKSFVTKVVGQWESDPVFRTKGGRAKVLSLGKDANSFSSLVAKVSKDLRSGTVLRELERVGLVERTKDKVKLLHTSYENDDAADILDVFVRDADDLMEAVEENIQRVYETPNLHVRTEYDSISVEHLPQIREWIYQEGAKFHKRVRDYVARYDTDLNPTLNKNAGGRVVLGSFSRCED